jgi:chromosome partitioning protein
MTDEFNDSRPRRRLFGRRRPDEDVAETPPPMSVEPEPAEEEVAVDEPSPAPEPVAPSAPPVVAEAPAPVPPAPPASAVPAPTPVVEADPLPAPPPTPAHPPPAAPRLDPVVRQEPHISPTPPEPAPEPSPVLDPPPPAPTSSVLNGAVPIDDSGSEPLEVPRIIAIANQKGGVGKTTTAVNLGAALAEAGLRVLVVDLDPQGNASTGLGINPRDVGASIYDVLMHDTPALDAVEPTSLKNLFVIPATLDLAGAEIELVPAFSRELKLKRALESVRTEYDVVLIDCPPSLGLLTVNGLAAADDVIVPIQCEYYALEGLGQLLRNVALVRSSLNAALDVRGIILTMYDARTRLAEQVETEVREHFGAKVYKTVVPRTVRLAEAPSFGQPVVVFDSTSRGAAAYRDLAKEVSGGTTRRTG